jgi:hypothetical protein
MPRKCPRDPLTFGVKVLASIWMQCHLRIRQILWIKPKHRKQESIESKEKDWHLGALPKGKKKELEEITPNLLLPSVTVKGSFCVNLTRR